MSHISTLVSYTIYISKYDKMSSIIPTNWILRETIRWYNLLLKRDIFFFIKELENKGKNENGRSLVQLLLRRRIETISEAFQSRRQEARHIYALCLPLLITVWRARLPPRFHTTVLRLVACPFFLLLPERSVSARPTRSPFLFYCPYIAACLSLPRIKCT